MKNLSLQQLVQRLQAATEVFANKVAHLNAINKFPVRDFDTGSNMFETLSVTLNGFNGDYSLLPKNFVLNSRGNSGIILGQILSGFVQAGLNNGGYCGNCQLVAAVRLAKQCAYGAVPHPKEGTMLTFIRLLADIDNWSAADLCDRIVAALKQTYNVNEFDAGAKGLYFLLKYAACLPLPDLISDRVEDVEETPLKYKYCTEFLCTLGAEFDREEFVDRLSALGDSINLSVVDGVLKAHVHNNNPFEVFRIAAGFGTVTYKKVDNMLMESRLCPSVAVVCDADEEDGLFPDVECEYICLSGKDCRRELQQKHASCRYARNIVLLTDRPELFAEWGDRLAIVRTYGYASKLLALLCNDEACGFEEYLSNLSDAAAVCHSVRLNPSDASSWKNANPQGFVMGNGKLDATVQVDTPNIYGVIVK